MDLFLLIERCTFDEDEWTLWGIFDSEKKAKDAGQYFLDNICDHEEDFEDGDSYFEIRNIKSNKLNKCDGYLFGYHGLPKDEFFNS